MIDREKVISDLEICVNRACTGCSRFLKDCGDEKCWDQLMKEAAELLEEQGEQTRPMFNGRYWECEKCGEMYQDILEVRKYRHCPWCGRRFEA